MKAIKLLGAPVSSCARIFIESLINELAATRGEQTLAFLGLEDELAAGGISANAHGLENQLEYSTNPSFNQVNILRRKKWQL